MLTYVSNDGKTYEERMVEAITNIPLYTDEWTNFNPSDPGMTILETLTGFETLQEERMADIPFKVRQNLLKLVGFTVNKGKSARLLLSAGNVRAPFTLPANHKFRLGSMVFETNKDTRIMDSHITGIYGYKQSESAETEEEKYTDFTFLIDREVKVPALIFGDHPTKGDALYFVVNNLPDPGEEITFFITMRERFNRNPLDGRTERLFADVVWECYTEKGWEPMDARDNTNAFIMSGEVKLWMPDSYAAVFTDAPGDGYAIRARLLQADYDVRPKVISVEAFLFEVWQKDTICECHSESKTGTVTLNSEIMEDAYVDVFCREAKGESYHKYEHRPDPHEEGRYYRSEHTGYGEVNFLFDKRLRGYGPERGRDCVKFVIYTEDVMRKYSLGQVLGYDNQEIDLPYDHVVAHSFCIIARRRVDGEYLYDFVRPERKGEGALYYHLLENDGKIIIEEAGRFIGAELYLCSVALTKGPDGNIREGNLLQSQERGDQLDEGVTYYNPGPGTGGAYREKLESVRQRFIKDMENPYTAVTESDYERVVLSTPGICLHKAKAEMDEERNLVRITVKQGTDENFPRLSEVYKKIIKERIEERRLLTTRVELIQPVYMPVNVAGTVYIKSHYDDAEKIIEETIANKIDYINSDKNFGEILKFDEVFHAIEMLDCVEYVYELSLRPKSVNGAKMVDADILPDANCLLYPGQIQVETVNFEN
ncbi:MAG: baseplate J/gp47 family protein [Lachnospiraceae bacterium]|nr:baseplate J/gp47 family protein [Lachnospiraceae bacterium]